MSASMWRVTVAAAVVCAGCVRTTGELPPELAAELAREGIVRRADDLTFRRTHRPGTARSTWDDKRASLVVTRQTVLLHVNGRPLVRITPRSTGSYDVHRDHDRLALRAGTGNAAISWSFRPRDDADGWARDIRAVIHGGAPPAAAAPLLSPAPAAPAPPAPAAPPAPPAPAPPAPPAPAPPAPAP